MPPASMAELMNANSQAPDARANVDSASVETVWIPVLLRWANYRLEPHGASIPETPTGAAGLPADTLYKLVEAVKGEPLDIKLSANPSANPSLNYGIVLRAAKAELKLFDLPLPRTCTSSVLATGDGDAALSLIWALALHWYLSRIEGIADKSGGEAALQHYLQGWVSTRVRMFFGDTVSQAPPIHDLTQSFADGKLLLAVLSSVDSRRFPFAPVSSATSNCRAVVQDCWSAFKTAKLLDPDELVSGHCAAWQHPRTMTLYLAELHATAFPAPLKYPPAGAEVVAPSVPASNHRSSSSRSAIDSSVSGSTGEGGLVASAQVTLDSLKRLTETREDRRAERNAERQSRKEFKSGSHAFSDRLASLREIVSSAQGESATGESRTNTSSSSRPSRSATSHGSRANNRPLSRSPPPPSVREDGPVEFSAQPAAPSSSSSMASFVMDYRESQLMATSRLSRSSSHRPSTNRSGSGGGNGGSRSRSGRSASQGKASYGGYGGGSFDEGDDDDAVSTSSFGSCSVLDDNSGAATESPQAVALKHKLFAGWLNALLLAKHGPPTAPPPPVAAGANSQRRGLPPQPPRPPPQQHLDAATLVEQATDAKLLLKVLEALLDVSFSQTTVLAQGVDNAARLANMTIVLRLIKKELKPFVKVRSTVQKDVLNGKATTVLNLLWCMMGARLVKQLRAAGCRVERVSELPSCVLHWCNGCLDTVSPMNGSILTSEAGVARKALLEELGLPGDTVGEVSGESWVTGKLLLHLLLRAGARKKSLGGSAPAGEDDDDALYQGAMAASSSSGGGGGNTQVLSRDLNEWRDLLNPRFAGAGAAAGSKVAVWAAAIGALSKGAFKSIPEGVLDAQLDCLVVWKSPHAMTLLLAGLLVAAGPKLPNVPDFLPGPHGGKLSAYDTAMGGPPSALLARARVSSSSNNYSGSSGGQQSSSSEQLRGPLPYRLPQTNNPAADPYASPTKPARPSSSAHSPNSPVSPLKEGSPGGTGAASAEAPMSNSSRRGRSPPPRPTKSPQPDELRAARRSDSPDPPENATGSSASSSSYHQSGDWRASFSQAANRASVRGMVSAIQDNSKASHATSQPPVSRRGGRSSSPRPSGAPPETAGGASESGAAAAAASSDHQQSQPSEALRAKARELQQRSSGSVNPRDSYMAVVHEAETLESVSRRLRDTERRLGEAETTAQQLRHDMVSVREEADSATAAKLTADARVKDLASALAAERAAHATTQTEHTALTFQVRTLKEAGAKAVVVDDSSHRLEGEVASLQKKLNTLQNQLEIEKSKSANANKASALMESKLSEAQAQVIESEVAKQARSEAMFAKDAELREAKTHLAHLLQALTGGGGGQGDLSSAAIAADPIGAAQRSGLGSPVKQALSPEDKARLRLASPPRHHQSSSLSRSRSPVNGGMMTAHGLDLDHSLSLSVVPDAGGGGSPIKHTKAAMQAAVAEARCQELEKRLRELEAEAEDHSEELRRVQAQAVKAAGARADAQGERSETVAALEEELEGEAQAREAAEARVATVEAALVQASAAHRNSEQRVVDLEAALEESEAELEDAHRQLQELRDGGGGSGKDANSGADHRRAADEAAITARAQALEEELESALGQIDTLEREADDLKHELHANGVSSGSGARQSPIQEDPNEDGEGQGYGEEDKDANAPVSEEAAGAGAPENELVALQNALENAFLQNTALESEAEELRASIARAEEGAAEARVQLTEVKEAMSALEGKLTSVSLEAAAQTEAAKIANAKLDAAEDELQRVALAANRAAGDLEAAKKAAATSKASELAAVKDLATAKKEAAQLKKDGAAARDRANAATASLAQHQADAAAQAAELGAELAAAERRAIAAERAQEMGLGASSSPGKYNSSSGSSAAGKKQEKEEQQQSNEAITKAAAEAVAAAQVEAHKYWEEATDLQAALEASQAHVATLQREAAEQSAAAAGAAAAIAASSPEGGASGDNVGAEQITALEASLSEALAKAEGLKEDLESYREAVASGEARIELLEQQLESKKAATEKLTAAVAEAEKQVTEAEQHADAMGTANKEWEDRCEELEQELKDAQAAIDTAREAAESAESRGELLEMQQANDNSSGGGDVEESQAALEAAKWELETEKTRATAAEAQRDEAQTALEAVKSELEAEKAKNTAADSQREEAQTALEAAKNELEAEKTKVTAAEAQRDEAQTALEAAKTELESEKTKVTAAESQREEVQTALEAAKNELEAEKTKVTAAEAQREEVQAALDAAKVAVEAEKAKAKTAAGKADKALFTAEGKTKVAEKKAQEAEKKLADAEAKLEAAVQNASSAAPEVEVDTTPKLAAAAPSGSGEENASVLNARVDELQKELDSALEQVKEAQEAAAAKDTELEEAEKALNEARAAAAAAESSAQEANEARTAAETALNNANMEHAALLATAEATAAAAEAKVVEVSTSRALQCSNAEGARDAALAELESLRASSNSNNNSDEVAALQRALAAAESECAAVEAKAAEQSKAAQGELQAKIDALEVQLSEQQAAAADAASASASAPPPPAADVAPAEKNPEAADDGAGDHAVSFQVVLEELSAEDFSSKSEEALLTATASALGVPVEQLQVLSVAAGSVVVDIRVIGFKDASSAQALVDSLASGALPLATSLESAGIGPCSSGASVGWPAVAVSRSALEIARAEAQVLMAKCEALESELSAAREALEEGEVREGQLEEELAVASEAVAEARARADAAAEEADALRELRAGGQGSSGDPEVWSDNDDDEEDDDDGDADSSGKAGGGSGASMLAALAEEAGVESSEEGSRDRSVKANSSRTRSGLREVPEKKVMGKDAQDDDAEKSDEEEDFAYAEAAGSGNSPRAVKSTTAASAPETAATAELLKEAQSEVARLEAKVAELQLELQASSEKSNSSDSSSPDSSSAASGDLAALAAAREVVTLQEELSSMQSKLAEAEERAVQELSAAADLTQKLEEAEVAAKAHADANKEWEDRCEELEQELAEAQAAAEDATEAQEAAEAQLAAKGVSARQSDAAAAAELLDCKQQVEVEKRNVERLEALLRQKNKQGSSGGDSLDKEGGDKEGSSKSLPARTPSLLRASSSSFTRLSLSGNVPDRTNSMASSGSDTSDRSRRSSFSSSRDKGQPKLDAHQKRIQKMKEKEAASSTSLPRPNGSVDRPKDAPDHALGLLPGVYLSDDESATATTASATTPVAVPASPSAAIAAAAAVGMEPLTGWAIADARHWNLLVTTYDELRTEVMELSTATQQYAAGSSTALAAQTDLADAFLRMAQGCKTSAGTAAGGGGGAAARAAASKEVDIYLGEADYFVQVCRIANDACAEGEFASDLANLEQQLLECKEKLDAVLPSLEKAEEFRLELSHYHLKLTSELGVANPAAAQAALDNSGKKKTSSLFGGSKDKKVTQNLEKREKALAQFNIFAAEVKRQLVPLKLPRMRVQLLEQQLEEQQSLHKRYSEAMGDSFGQIIEREEEEEELGDRENGGRGDGHEGEEDGEEGEYYDEEEGYDDDERAYEDDEDYEESKDGVH